MLVLLLAACGPDAVAWRAGHAEVSVEPDVLLFEATAVGASSRLPVTLTNTGAERAVVGLEVTAPFSVDRSAVDLGAGGTATVEVSFTPVGFTDSTGALTLSGDAAGRLVLSGTVETDADGDGEPAEAAGGADCDDDDPAVHPGATDTCGDGIDTDCVPDGDDCDEDDAPADMDCDDEDPARFPGAEETTDGLDQDCDGRVDEHLFVGGELVLAELSPLAPAWLELCNVAERDVAVDGLTLRTDAGTASLPGGTVAAGACEAVCASAIAGCAFTAELVLDGEADTIVLAAEGLVIDAVALDASWGWDPGWIWSLDPGSLGADQNNVPGAWCGTAGSPGETNTDCP